MRMQVLEWTLDTRTREIQGRATTVRLRPLAFQVFQHLIARAPAVVSKQELLDEVWDSQAVSDGAIVQVIRELRANLGDDVSSPRFIGAQAELAPPGSSRLQSTATRTGNISGRWQ